MGKYSFPAVPLLGGIVVLILPGLANAAVVGEKASFTTPCWNPEEYYYEVTQRCYLVKAESRGPCGEMMTLTPKDGDTNSPFAECQCEFTIYKGCPDRPLLFWPEKSRCYRIFDQGPCPPGSWLTVRGEKNVPTCSRIPCAGGTFTRYDPQEDPTRFIFPYNGTCYETQERGFCPSESERVYFLNGGSLRKPICTSEYLGCGRGGLSNTQPLPCSDGSVRDTYGGCPPRANFP